ncbi:alkane hydroxylase MAH1-like [Mercurialis annua]|uniref:alkane hydroxylase MAH1-like n=1 Tax=Mercurialis annua TaxID=3986 RepID=UPI002160C8FD|nr:alkane hydroxylase MAH1-like [Mercurialis annua]
MALLSIFEVILASICFAFGCYLSNRNEIVWNWPLFGMLPSLLANIHRFHDWTLKMFEKAGGTYHVKGPWFINMDMIGTVDPANVKYMMSTNSSNYPKGSEYKEIFGDIFGSGIFNSDHDQWKNQRKVAAALINHQRFRPFLFDTISVTVENALIPVLDHFCKQGGAVDMQDIAHRFTYDVIVKVITGSNPETLTIELPKNEFSDALDHAEEAIFYRHLRPKIFWRLQKWLGFGLEKEMKIARVIIDRIVASYVARKTEQLIKDGEGGADFLGSYLTVHQNDEKLMQAWKSKDEFLRDTLVNFLIAGRENSLGWLFWLVAKNPVVEAKIREELSSLSPKKRDKIEVFELEEVNKLVYLHGAICETLRLYPPVMYEHKKPLQSDILPSGHYVDPKMEILLSGYVMGRMKSIWGDDCLEFKPERWISMEDGRLIQHSPYKFLAFNAGARTCLGKDTAIYEMKAMASVVFHNYDIQLVEEHHVVPNCSSIILHIKHGMMAKISRRRM